MKRIVLGGLQLVARGVGRINRYVNARVVGNNELAPDRDTEPSICITEASIQVTANPSEVMYGQSSTVSWSVDQPAGCASTHILLNGRSVARSGRQTVVPARTTAFTVVVSETRLGQHAEVRRYARVSVVYPERVVIDASTSNPVQVLLGALDQPNRIVDGKPVPIVIELCDVDLDLTGRTSIAIGDNRSLIASPACARGPRSFGPRIFVTDRRGNQPLFEIRGDNIRFSGFRLEGPTSGIAQGDIKEVGILVFPFESADPIHNIEISNMEIYHWSGAGVQLRDNVVLAERGRLFNTNPDAVRIKGNYFHHNRHGDGEGYGVSSTGGAYVTIEQNVFDENRHAIAGISKNDSGRDYAGYTARDNLILSGGGKHCTKHWLGAVLGWRFNCRQTHQIDMHGDQNEWYSDDNWMCGTAGETIIIERNTILYTSGTAIEIRGNPVDKAVVDGNVFKNSSRSDAIAQTGACGWGDNISNPIDVRPNNVFGVDPMAELGSCDFFGDGQEDQFMATGVTWWAKSPVTGQWRYLNTRPERLPQLVLRDFDHDGKCDIAFRAVNSLAAGPHMYSKNGTGPLVPLQVVTE